MIRLGVDIGGTFTDFVFSDPEGRNIRSFKLLSTPEEPAQAVLDGLDFINRQYGIELGELTIIHGSTVATNALLERKGARTALITTQGFRDVLQIGRQNRPSLYDFSVDPPAPLVPEHLRLEISERIDHRGNILTPVNESEANELIARLKDTGVESIAICLLFSFLHPEHEQVIAEKLRAAGYFVSASVDVLPEYREYERSSTTVVNAYVSPVLSQYLERLQAGIQAHSSNQSEQVTKAVPLSVMQSNGGVINPAEASRKGVNCVLSGPAGGVIGSRLISYLASTSSSNLDFTNIITFDMGGTSTDVSLIAGTLQVTTEAEIGGQPIALPMLDIHTIGAGGGSIARLDPGGALRVGPESAGASPGPACYGVGELPTVTDANLVLGRLSAEHFLGGKMPLHVDRAKIAIERLGRQAGMDLRHTASGILEVANAHMERALRVISVERGHDPQDFTLLSFGGAGGLHAANLARILGIPKVLVPPFASTLSAFGMLAADIVKDFSRTVMLTGSIGYDQLEKQIKPLEERGIHEVEEEGISTENIRLIPMLDVRYHGQSYELTVPFTDTYHEDFHQAHFEQYGYARRKAELEIVNLRVQAVGKVIRPIIARHPRETADSSQALLFSREVILSNNESRDVPFYSGERLRHENTVTGPAVILREDTTVLLEADDQALVDPYLNLVITIGGR